MIASTAIWVYSMIRRMRRSLALSRFPVPSQASIAVANDIGRGHTAMAGNRLDLLEGSLVETDGIAFGTGRH